MKIAIGSKIIKGPWGGGNLFSKNLKVYLENNNINVVNHLIENNIDIILKILFLIFINYRFLIVIG